MKSKTRLKKPLTGRLCAVLAVAMTLVHGVASAENQLRAYVTNLGSNTVSVIDVATNTVVASVPVGTSPVQVAVTLDGTKVYVTNEGSNTVSVIDTLSNSVSATVPVGSTPEGVAITPDGTRAYVANLNSGFISVIDTSTDTVVDTITLASGRPFGVAFTPDGTRAYVPLGQNSVAVIDTATNTEVGTVSMGTGQTGPLWVAITPDGSSAYVVNRNGNFVAVIDIATDTVIDTISLSGGHGVAITPDGSRAYVASDLTVVTVIDTATNTIADTIATIAIPPGDRFVAFTPDGSRAYVTNDLAVSVTVIDTSTNTIVAIIPVEGRAFGVAIASVFVAPSNSGPECTADLSDADANFLQPSPGSYVVTEGEMFEAVFTGDDTDGDDLSAVVSGLPGASISPASGPAPLVATLQWTPTAAQKTGAPYSVTVTFTDTFGETASCDFVIEDVNLRPVCNAGGDQVIECESLDGVDVALNGSATDPDDDDATLMFHWAISDTSVILNDPNIAIPSGTFPIEVTMATLTVADGRGGVAICDVLITVQDTTPPEVMCTTDVASLWPPKHNMRSVTLFVTTSDVCETTDPNILPLIVTVSSNEPDNTNGDGDGNTTGDVNGFDGFNAPVDVTLAFSFDATVGTNGAWVATIQLRAERDGAGDGRAYKVDVIAFDTFNNINAASCVVVVPHDRRGG